MKNKLELFGTTWKIKYVDKLIHEDGHEIYGEVDNANKTILIANKLYGKNVKESEKQLSLLHELVHAFFITGQYYEEWDNEPLVEWMARCINQCIKSKIF